MSRDFRIAGRKVGSGHPVFIIAEMSANHHQDLDEAIKIIHAAKECGADAVKLQHYTPDTMTIDSDREYFKIKGTLWEGETLYSLYKKAYMPWEWTQRLRDVAQDVGIILFSTPFDKTAVDFLQNMDVPAYKVASFELVDIPLIEYIAKMGKPMIMSTGMATLAEISEAVDAAKGAGAKDIALLKCTSAYPSPPEEMNIRTIPHLAEAFGVVSGLSDHTMGVAVSVAAVALGSNIIEKHFTLSRAKGGADAAFSLEPHELRVMVEAVRTAEKALGTVSYTLTAKERESMVFRRSLFAVRDIKAGEVLTHENVRSIRPGHGLAPKCLNDVLGRKAKSDIKMGTPLSWDWVQ